jgi:enoyl-CoA hydratase
MLGDYEYKNILVDVEERIATILINRPKALNALNTEVLKELEDVFDRLERDDGVRVCILTGKGDKSFVAGADISEMRDMDPLAAISYSKLGHAVLSKIENLSKPTIAAINGFALGGGCELAMSMDIRLASKNAILGQPEVKLGVIPGFGGTQRLPRLIGPAKAKELILTGRTITADEAERIGLVNKVVGPDVLMKEARDVAKEIANAGRFAVTTAKLLMNRGLNMDLDSAMILETQSFGICFSSGEPAEGMGAFLEKKKPDFK